ncbi:MAG: monovalent cation/H+ antiporter subunit D family protein [Deltaproteobacteria bacterium]|nr:monovalent cation/H+ antiporter subunit D family protein [Deltaproteobacteria bacterium]MBW2049038.1 monovalent cation/H+ antiporter subunit D family protein [Deltaproteobacteria bacterium]MBW2112209.1 monovalent cation/H+ antiporter subunit D family protein [Deltaproteobacteria bacterium]MBW2353169.1 monovalent cation/H+ antiporter subunit D family protein [Deltaproteobacteria bacterium]
METIYSIKPLIAVLVSICAVPLLVLSRKSPNMREGWTFVAAAVKFVIIISMLPAVLEGRQIVYTLAEVIPGAAIRFRVDSLGMVFALVASFLWIVTSAYSIGYMRGLKEHSQTRYFCFFALALSATIGVAFSANLLTLYLFYEMLSLATYPLVTHHQDMEARSSGRKYLTYILGTSVGLLLPAMLISYNLAGTLEFSSQGFLAGTCSREMVVLLLLFFLFGFAKAAVMPFHGWLPAAMVAPTPVSALLHAVAVVKVGVFSVVRVLTGVFGTDLLSSLDLGLVICIAASFTIIVASLIALSQDNLKRLLAFSTIGQLSYIVLGVGLLSPRGMTGGILHIAMHAFGKITLFFCAGAIFVATGKRNISEMKGIGKRMPLTMAAFFLASLSIIGLPPTGGFWSKWYLVLGSLEAHETAFLVVLLTSSLLNAAYFMPVVYRAFFSAPGESAFEDGVQEAPLLCLVPLMFTAAGSVIFFFYPQPFFRLATMVVRAITGG